MGGAGWWAGSSSTKRQRRKKRQKQQKVLEAALRRQLESAGVFEATSELDTINGGVPDDTKLAVLLMGAMAAQAQGIELPAETAHSVSQLQRLFAQKEAEEEDEA